MTLSAWTMTVDSIVVLPVARSRVRAIALSALALLAVGWFALLAVRPLYHPDEGRYAEIPREMLAGSSWIIPHLNGLVYLEKPPLQYWLTAAVMHVLGPGEFASRIITGLAGLLTLLVVYATALQLWGARAARDAVLLLLGASLFTLLSHQLTLDMVLTFWLTCALACFIRAQSVREDLIRNRRWMLGCWAAMAAAVMTKGLIGVLIPAMTLLLYSVLQRDYLLYDRLNLRWGVPLFTLLAAPWFILAGQQNSDFLHFFFIREHVERYLTTIEHRVQPWWFFILVLIAGVLPWIWPALRSLATDWRRRVAWGRFDPVRLLWVWSAFILVFFSLSDSKLIPYILPAVPALALSCARRNPRRDVGAASAGAVLTLLSALALALCVAISLTPPMRDHAAMQTVQAFRTPLLWMAIALESSAVFAIRTLRRRPARALALVCIGWCVATGALLSGSVQGDALFSSRDLALLLQRRVSAAEPVYSVGGYDQTVPFYLGRSVTLVAYRDEFDLGLSQDPSRGIASLEQFTMRWRELPQGYALVAAKTWPQLNTPEFEHRLLARSRDWLLLSRR